LNAIVKEAWNTSEQTEDRREKIQALSLVVSVAINSSIMPFSKVV
jgi:hypothetical protein